MINLVLVGAGKWARRHPVHVASESGEALSHLRRRPHTFGCEPPLRVRSLSAALRYTVPDNVEIHALSFYLPYPATSRRRLDPAPALLLRTHQGMEPHSPA